MRTVCIYHSIDLDGWMSAAIVKLMYEKVIKERSEYRKEDMSLVHTMEFIGYNYGDTIPDLSSYEFVIMCDISFPKDIMIKLSQEKEFIWIDHHVSAIRDNICLVDIAQCEGSKIKLNLNSKFAACELTWQYFFPNDPMPEIVRLLGRYDCFGHKGTDEERKVLEFQYGARQCISNYKEAYNYLIDEGANYKNPEINTINIIYEKGKSIYQYLCTEAKQAYKNGFKIILREYRDELKLNPFDLDKGTNIIREFICINKERFNPINFGIDYHKDGYDGCACFHIDSTGTYCFSLYNDNGLVDCSLIAKQFGGGGHKGAAGFRVKDVLKVINNA